MESNNFQTQELSDEDIQREFNQLETTINSMKKQNRLLVKTLILVMIFFTFSLFLMYFYLVNIHQRDLLDVKDTCQQNILKTQEDFINLHNKNIDVAISFMNTLRFPPIYR